MGAAAQERRAVRVGDVTQDERYIQHVAETHSELDVPMLIGKRLVGVLNAESPYLDAFDRDDEELALVLAGQAAVAIYNAQLFQAAQERIEQRLGDLRALQEVYAAIGRESLEEVLRRVVERAGLALFTSEKVPCGDGGVSFGQAVYAGCGYRMLEADGADAAPVGRQQDDREKT